MHNKVLWDAGIHVYDDAYPVRPGLLAKPPHAPISHYLSAHDSLGVDRIVLSQPSAYGFDNALLLDTLDSLSGSGRGIIVLPPTQNRSELEDLHRRGVRGVRFLMSPAGALGWDDIAPWSNLAADLDWVLKFQLTSEQLVGAAELLALLPCKVLLDVYPGALSLDPDTVALLVPLIRNGRTWLCFTAPEEGDKAFNDAARVMTKSHPQNSLQASNWPTGLSGSRSPTRNGVNWLKGTVGHPLALTVMGNAGQLFNN